MQLVSSSNFTTTLMKSFNKLFFSPIILIALLSFGCNGFLDVNDNPNAPVSENLKLSATFPAALVASVNQETGQLNQLGALWGGYWGTTSEGINLFFNQKTYNGPGLRDVRDGFPVWETTYTTLLYYRLIRNQAAQEGALFYEGAAKIMQGFHFLRLVDFYDNIPFDEALQGTTHATPAYESGEMVYKKAVDLISEGIEDMKNAPAGTLAGQDDVLFAGNVTLWAKFGNTVKLRALVRQSEVSPLAYIQEEIKKINIEGSGFLMLGQSAMVQPGYLNSAGKLNPFWENYYRNVQNAVTGNYQDIRPTQFLLEQYQLRNDPRLNQLYVPVKGEFRGVLFGDPEVNHSLYGRNVTSPMKGPAENNGQAGALLKSSTQASVLLSSFESLFLQAEAAQRGWISDAPKSLYEAAIQESFSYMNVEKFLFTAYNSQESVAYDGSLAKIITQKWLSLNSISSIEAWNDYRRLGLPNFPNSLQSPNPTAHPLRLMYPETERMTNLDEVLKQGNDNITESRIWWAK
ncbi:Starch-binding associating with outer membrane [Rhodonellum ikkaensis]|nr:Starch-binding associating with outer membrane [Rhodonellum ikkaensis]